ncbi:unnamed protein product [Boreogadus saida]
MQEPAGVQQTGLLLSRICPCCHGCKAIARGEEGKGADNLIGGDHIVTSHHRPSLSTTLLGAHRQVEVGQKGFLNQATVLG